MNASEDHLRTLVGLRVARIERTLAELRDSLVGFRAGRDQFKRIDAAAARLRTIRALFDPGQSQDRTQAAEWLEEVLPQLEGISTVSDRASRLLASVVREARQALSAARQVAHRTL
jgi:hypothetical protein